MPKKWTTQCSPFVVSSIDDRQMCKLSAVHVNVHSQSGNVKKGNYVGRLFPFAHICRKQFLFTIKIRGVLTLDVPLNQFWVMSVSLLLHFFVLIHFQITRQCCSIRNIVLSIMILIHFSMFFHVFKSPNHSPWILLVVMGFKVQFQKTAPTHRDLISQKVQRYLG